MAPDFLFLFQQFPKMQIMFLVPQLARDSIACGLASRLMTHPLSPLPPVSFFLLNPIGMAYW